MTYYKSYGGHSYGGHSYSYTSYEWTAFREADLLEAGDHNLGCGDSFTMPGSATVCLSTTDNDKSLSGDNYCNENANDSSGQWAEVDGTGQGGQFYAESYHVLQGSDGKTYYLIEIEIEGQSGDFFSFYGDVPPAGTELTITGTCNVKGDWVNYNCLDAGPKVETGSITGTVWCDADCDGIQDAEITYEKGDSIWTDSVTFEGVTCTTYNVCDYGSWTSTGAQVIDLVVGTGQGHSGNAHDNTLVELDQGGVWTRTFTVDQAGTFCLTLDTYKNFCVDDGGNTFQIKVNGVIVETVVVTADGALEVSLDLPAGHNKIQFVSASDACGYGAGIDNIELLPLVAVTTPSEMGKAGVTVKLLDAITGEVLATTTTDAEGNYSFDDVPVGAYKIMGVAPDGTEFTIQDAGSDDSVDSDVDGSGTSGVVTVSAGETTDIDLGLCEAPEPGSLSGKYFLDDNRDGLDNDGANGIGGILVELLDASGTPTGATVLTNADGSYAFTGLEAGTYGVKFTDPDTGRELTTQDVDGNASDGIDSDAADLGGGMSQITGITVLAGAETADNDAGAVVRPGAISGTYFCDVDYDDSDDGASAGDPDIVGQLVTLLNTDGSPALDIDGNPVAPVQTDAFGDYSFTNLAPGDYVVQFAAPPSKEFVAPNAGDPANDSDVTDPLTGQTRPITVVAGETTENIDAGVRYLPGGLSGRYFDDLNGNDVDDGEPGIAGVIVELLDAAGDPATDIDGNPVAALLTGPDGSYAFTNLAPGSYSVKFTDAVSGKELVTPDQGGDETSDSDAVDLGGGMSQITGITVLADTITEHNDAGVKGTASVGDTVWYDENGDGIRQASEGLAAGVGVALLADLDMDGDIDDVLATTTTDSNGAYLFDGLAAGDYAVQFDEVDDFVFTTQSGAAADAANDDSDADATGLTGSFSLAIGQAQLNIDAGLEAENTPPRATPDSGMGCADEDIVVDLSDNYFDADSASVGIVSLAGQAITDGQTILIDGLAIGSGGPVPFTGLEVTRSGDSFIFDGEAAFASLDIGESAQVVFDFTVQDSDGAAVISSLEVTFCGDANSVESFNGSLPASGTYQVVSDLDTIPPGTDAFAVKVDGTGDARFDGVIFDNAYCLSATDNVLTGADFDTAAILPGDILAATDAAGGGVFDPGKTSFFNGQSAADNLDLIKYIVAQDYEGQGTYDGWDVQWAIWELTDGFNSDDFVGFFDGLDSASVDAILADAALYGEGFDFGVGGVNGAIIDPNPATTDNSQPFIIGFDWEDFDCLCADGGIGGPGGPGDPGSPF